MCRLAAYTGPEIPLCQLLLEPEHSLLVQSWGPQEMAEAVLNADGFGFGWYGDDGVPGKYINTVPMWSDVNLEALGRSLRSAMWLANVRSATPGQAVSLDNTQPFIDGGIMYLHNGYIKGFGESVRARFHEFLAPAIQAGIQGNTDSEYLFALFRQQFTSNPDPLPALRGLLASLSDLLAGAPALVNIVVSDGQSLIACRHACNDGACPTLYYTDSHPDFPDAALLASERFSSPAAWEPVAEDTILVIAPDRTVDWYRI
ncbi:MAG: ergothioneine biosynthesis protein EgtC [Gammaproteobacteria bacterium]|jgi:glutamine amidotransferase